MSTRRSRRTAHKIVPWLATGVAAVLISTYLALIAWTWLQQSEMNAFRSTLQAEQRQREAAVTQLAALQSTATALTERLAAIEASAEIEKSSAVETPVTSPNSAQEIEDLKSAVAEIRLAVSSLQAESNRVPDNVGDGQDTAAADLTDPTPDSARLTVARQQQSHNLSCESSAASMTAQYHGVQLSEEEILALLPRSSNPHLGFRGNVDGPTGGTIDYGVYAGPILDILNARGLQAKLVSGGLEGIEAAITRGNPVIAWVTYNCLPSTSTTVAIDGQDVVLVPNQHAVVVTGFNNEGVWANDPWDGQEDFYTIADFTRAMRYFDDMAIEVGKP